MNKNLVLALILSILFGGCFPAPQPAEQIVESISLGKQLLCLGPIGSNYLLGHFEGMPFLLQNPNSSIYTSTKTYVDLIKYGRTDSEALVGQLAGVEEITCRDETAGYRIEVQEIDFCLVEPIEGSSQAWNARTSNDIPFIVFMPDAQKVKPHDRYLGRVAYLMHGDDPDTYWFGLFPDKPAKESCKSGL